jgi:hypothetical protein
MNMFHPASDANLIPTFDPLKQALMTALSHGGLDLDDLPVGAMVEVKTAHHTYLIENCGNDQMRISGHPVYCPEPVLVEYLGAIDGTPRFGAGAVVPGMRMTFRHPGLGIIRTSKVQELQQLLPVTRAN